MQSVHLCFSRMQCRGFKRDTHLFLDTVCEAVIVLWSEACVLMLGNITAHASRKDKSTCMSQGDIYIISNIVSFVDSGKLKVSLLLPPSECLCLGDVVRGGVDDGHGRPRCRSKLSSRRGVP